VLANLLGTYGVRALLLERNPTTVGEPRAVSIDDESLRVLQAAGVIGDVLPDVVQGYGVHYYSWSGRVFARIEPTSREFGFPKRNAFRQPLLEATLHRALARFQNIDVRMGHELRSFSDEDSRVVLDVARDGEVSRMTCDWLIGCDGGRSFVRERLGVALEGATYAERWLIVDLAERRNPFRHTRTYCDPARPAIRLPGPHGTVRYEFMLREGETPEDMLDETRIREWIAQREPSDADLRIVRKVVYTFHARVASRWRVGRVLLAGDAAHLTPPFAGQGMNSGVRDAANLAWKLAGVVKGEFGEALLDSYETERKPHARALIEMAMRIGRFMQPKTLTGAMLMQGVLRLLTLYPPARDYILHLKFKPKPRFADGFFARDDALKGNTRPGQMLVQPQVELHGGARALLDDVLGPGFAFVGWRGDMMPDHVPSLPSLRRVQLVRRSDDFPSALPAADEVIVRDCDGILESALAEARADALLVRPDRYVLSCIRLQMPEASAIALRTLLDAAATSSSNQTLKPNRPGLST